VCFFDSQTGVGVTALLMFSDAQAPPFQDLVGGECGLMADGGSFVRLKADKSITIDTSTGNGNVVVNAGTGHVTMSAQEVDVTATGKVKVTAPDIELGASGGVVQPVKLADNSASVVLKAQ
jgi:phage gp45-like